ERGEEMIEANQVFDLKTAAEWNERGNAHLKAGDYNDAIVAYTKAIELAPEACWPYIQNLAQVHYQKGKAVGKQNIGKIEDPDVWEGEDETEPASIVSYDSLITPNQTNGSEEPKLEKSTETSAAILPPTAKEIENTQEKLDGQPKENTSEIKVPVQEQEKEPAIAMSKTCCSKLETTQSSDPGMNIAQDQSSKPQNDGNYPHTSSDWNEMGNLLINSKKFNEAIEAYKKAIETDPKNGQPYSNLGFIYYRMGKYDFAVLLYKKSIDLLSSPEDKAISWNMLGDAYRRLGDYGNALEAYKKSGENKPAVSPVMARARAALLENIVAG
ncbi:MAG: tetratricopeptide repeat protein, partial [Anaerolineales bacterium]